jgi:hypothetical protein
MSLAVRSDRAHQICVFVVKNKNSECSRWVNCLGQPTMTRPRSYFVLAPTFLSSLLAKAEQGQPVTASKPATSLAGPSPIQTLTALIEIGFSQVTVRQPFSEHAFVGDGEVSRAWRRRGP